jgi:glycosyltransferase involved in cell wall biosynthesis
VETLLQAFQLVREKCSRRCQLVLVGSRRWASQELRSAPAFDEDAAVSFLGYVPREDLALLYGAAELFVSVSLFEGFGLPALEAMACGTPVVASRVGALPEVVGDAGSLVDPRDVDGIAAAIINLLEDQEARDQLAERARQRSSQFAWERAARMAQAVFAELARG